MMNTNATTPRNEKNLRTTTEVVTVTKNIVLEGVRLLRAESFVTTFEVVTEFHPKTNQPIRLISKRKLDEKVEPLCFLLIEVTPDILADYRKKGIASFILKTEGRLFYSEIPDNMNFVSSTGLGLHKCANSGKECHRLSAASNEDGGCAKVRSRARCIERYPWIVAGYETFNTSHDSFVVVKCLHYEKSPSRKQRTADEIKEVRMRLVEFV